jgi:hypothetical protein
MGTAARHSGLVPRSAAIPHPGRLSVHWWGLNATDQKIYMCLSVGYSDSSRTAEEWIAENPEWHVTKDPLVMLQHEDDKESSDN